MKKLSLWLVVLSIMTALLPATMVSASDQWFDIEVEDGQHDGDLLTDEAGQGSFFTVQGTDSATKTTSSFELDNEGTFDVWAVIGTHSNGNNLCSYTFNLDGTDINKIDAGSAYNADAEIYTGKEVAGGHPMTMIWAKVASNVAVDAGTHSLVAEISKAAFNFNKFGQMDLVRFVPSSWNWKPSANFDAPVDNSAAGWRDIEVENGQPDGTDPLLTVPGGRGSFYKPQWAKGATKTTSSFELKNAGTFDVWAVIGTHSAGNDLCSYTFSLDGTNFDKIDAGSAYNADAAIYTGVDVTGGGHTMTMIWAKVASNVAVDAGTHSIVAEISDSANNVGNKFGQMDLVRIVPSSWNWVPGANFDDPEDMSSGGGDIGGGDNPASGWFDVEAEEGQYDGDLLIDDAGRGSFYTVQGTPSATKTTSSFELDNEGTFDVWAVIGTHSNGNNLCSYTFNLDGTDINNIGAGSAYNANAAIYTGTNEVAVGHKMTMVWAKVAGSVAVSAGTHSLVAEISAAPLNTNTFGQMDLVRFVPSSWNWKPGANFDDPVDNSGAGWLHVEAEDGLENSANLYPQNWASGGAAVIAVEAAQTSESNTTINIPSEGQYDIYATIALPFNDVSNSRGGYEFSIDGSTFYKKYAAEISAANDAAFNRAWLTNDAYLADVKWVKIGSSVDLTAGSHSLTSKIIMGEGTGAYGVGVIDCIRFVPSSWNWVPTGANYNDPEDMSSGGGDIGGGDNPPAPEPGDTFTSETGIFWMESADAGFNSSCWQTVTNKSASGGSLLDAGTPGAIDVKQYEMIYSFETEEETVYDVWALVHNLAAHNSVYKFTMDGTELTSSAYGNKTYLSESTGFAGYNHEMTWQKVVESKNIEAGEHTFVVAPQESSMFPGRILAAADCVVLVPTSMKWKPNTSGADAEMPNASSGRIAAEYIKSNYFGGDYTKVTDNIDLPEIGTVAGATITYECDQDDVISADGVVTRPYFNTDDIKVNFKICATASGTVTKLEVPMTVLKNTKYTAKDLVVSEDITAGGTFAASVDVNVNAAADSGITGKASLIVALFGANGALEDIAINDGVISSDGSTLEATLPMPENVVGKTVKVFLVNGLEMGNQLIETVVVD